MDPFLLYCIARFITLLLLYFKTLHPGFLMQNGF